MAAVYTAGIELINDVSTPSIEWAAFNNNNNLAIQLHMVM